MDFFASDISGAVNSLLFLIILAAMQVSDDMNSIVNSASKSLLSLVPFGDLKLRPLVPFLNIVLSLIILGLLYRFLIQPLFRVKSEVEVAANNGNRANNDNKRNNGNQ